MFKVVKNVFVTFEAHVNFVLIQDCVAGLNFSSENEAKVFTKALKMKLTKSQTISIKLLIKKRIKILIKTERKTQNVSEFLINFKLSNRLFRSIIGIIFVSAPVGNQDLFYRN